MTVMVLAPPTSSSRLLLSLSGPLIKAEDVFNRTIQEMAIDLDYPIESGHDKEGCVRGMTENQHTQSFVALLRYHFVNL